MVGKTLAQLTEAERDAIVFEYTNVPKASLKNIQQRFGLKYP